MSERLATIILWVICLGLALGMAVSSLDALVGHDPHETLVWACR